MNLIKTQEHLNMLPASQQTVQYLAAAANGQNPNVPPWLALARMDEVKKEMDSAAQMQMAAQQGENGTVKAQILGSFMPPQLRQMPGQGAGLPRPQMGMVQPQGVPQAQAQARPQMQMPTQQQARPPQGGIAQLQGMAPRRFREGGIVSLAEGSDGRAVGGAEPAEAMLTEDEQQVLRDRERLKNAGGVADDLIRLLPRLGLRYTDATFGRLLRAMGAMDGHIGAPGTPLLPNIAGMQGPEDKPSPTQYAIQAPAEDAKKPAPGAEAGTGSVGGSASRASNVRTSGIAAGLPNDPGAKFLLELLGQKGPDEQAEYDRRWARQEALRGQLGLNKPANEEYDKYLRGQYTDESRGIADLLKGNESARSKRALFDALIAGGEASRGMGNGLGGIGAIAGGFGKSLSSAQTSAEDRAVANAEFIQKMTFEGEKLKASIQEKRRAEAEGRFADAQQIQKDIDAQKQKLNELKATAAGRLAADASAERREAMQSATQRDVASLRGSAGGKDPVLKLLGEQRDNLANELKTLMPSGVVLGVNRERADNIKRQIAAIDAKINALLGLSAGATTAPGVSSGFNVTKESGR